MSSNCTLRNTSKCDLTLYIGNTFVIAIISAMGILTNTCCILIFTKSSLKSHFKGSAFTFMLGLSIIDLINSLLMFPFGVLHCECINSPSESEYIRASYGAYVIQPVYNAFAASSVWTTVAMSVDRFIFISKPILSRGICKPLTAKVGTIFITISCILLHIPFFFQVTFDKDKNLLYTDFGRSHGFNVYLWIRHVIAKFIPIVSVAVLNTCLLVTVIKARNRYKRTFTTNAATNQLSSRQNIHQRAKSKTTMLLVCLCTVFLVCHTPEPFGHVPIFRSLFGDCLLFGCAHQIYVMVTNILELLSFAIPFYIYVTLNNMFRKSVIECILCGRESNINSVNTLTMK